MLLNVQECQVALIDYQAKLMPAIAEGAQVLAAARRLARMAQLVGVPVWATEQSPDKLGATDAELASLCTRIVPKTAFSAAAVLEPLLAPAPKEPPVPKGNARSLPKHLRKARLHHHCRLRDACVPAADGAGAAGGRVGRVRGGGCLRLARRAPARRRL